MSQLNSSVTRRTGLRARHALWLVVMAAALASCADTDRNVDELQPAPTTQIVTQADESQETDTRNCEPGKRAHSRADHRQDRDRSEHRRDHRGPRAGSWDEGDENENERDEDDNEQDENEQDENDNDD
jgi:hypothetical protein